MPLKRRPSFVVRPLKKTPAELDLPKAQIDKILSEMSSRQSGDILNHEYLDNTQGAASAGSMKTATILFAQSSKRGGKLIPFYLRNDLILGEGSGGKVIKAVNLMSYHTVACKISEHYEDLIDDIGHERETLNALGRLKGLATTKSQIANAHESVVQYHSYTLMEYFDGTSLRNHLYEEDGSKKVFSFLHLIPLALGAIKQMQSFHEMGLVMRDIKPDNFLLKKILNKSNSFKLAFVDVGSVQLAQQAAINKSLDGTSTGYIAPELLTDSVATRPGYSVTTDIYALGVMCGEIISKCSYQDYLSTTSDRIGIEQIGFRPLNHDEMTAGMSDIFNVKIPPMLPPRQKGKYPKQDERTEVLQSEAELIYRELIALINDMCNPNPSYRIKPDALMGKVMDLKFRFSQYQAKRCPKGLLGTIRGRAGSDVIGKGGTFGSNSVRHNAHSVSDAREGGAATSEAHEISNLPIFSEVESHYYFLKTPSRLSTSDLSTHASCDNNDAEVSFAAMGEQVLAASLESMALDDPTAPASTWGSVLPPSAKPILMSVSRISLRPLSQRITEVGQAVDLLKQLLLKETHLGPRGETHKAILIQSLEQCDGYRAPSDETLEQTRHFLRVHSSSSLFDDAQKAFENLVALFDPVLPPRLG